jgi:hypothetical protein
MLESGEQSPCRKQESKDENLRQRRQAQKTSTLFNTHTHTQLHENTKLAQRNERKALKAEEGAREKRKKLLQRKTSRRLFACAYTRISAPQKQATPPKDQIPEEQQEKRMRKERAICLSSPDSALKISTSGKRRDHGTATARQRSPNPVNRD